MPVIVTTPDYNPFTHENGDGVGVFDGLLYVTKANGSTVGVYSKWDSATIETAEVQACPKWDSATIETAEVQA